MWCDCCLSVDKRKLKAFAKTTPFTFAEIVRLAIKFRQLDEDGSGRLEFKELSQLGELKANPFARRLCQLFSEDGSESLCFRQFVNLTGVFCERTSPDTKLIWAFAMWDFDGDDLIGREDINTGLRLITSVPEGRSGSLAASRTNRGLTDKEVNKVLEMVYHEVDPDEGGLSFTDFKSVASRMPDFFANFRLTV